MSLSFETFEHDGLYAHLHTAANDRFEDQIYLDLIWRITDGLDRYAIPRYHREAGVFRWGEPYALVDWEYEVEVEQDREVTRDSIRGFVPARSAVPQVIHPSVEPPSPYAAGNANKAGVFRMWRPESLAEVVGALQLDASAELNLFALGAAPGGLVDATTRTERPRLAAVLGPEDVFVDLVIGVDIGYSNILLIESRTDLSGKLESLADG